MTASPEVWRFIYGWGSFYFVAMVLVGIMTYEGLTGFGWVLMFFSGLSEQIQGFMALFG